MKPRLSLYLSLIAAIAQSGPYAYADENYSYQVYQEPKTTPIMKKIEVLPYSETKFNLAYQTFLYANDVHGAYALALSATKQNPESKIWLERLAQTALWSNRQQEALQAYITLITRFNEKKYITNAVTLGERLGRNDILTELYQAELLKSPHDVSLMQKLALSYNRRGNPEKALDYLTKVYARTHDDKLLETMAAINIDNKNNPAAITILKRLAASHRNAPKTVLTLTALLMEEGKYENAYELLKQLPPPDESKLSADYWQQLAFASWMLGKDKDSQLAYNTLDQHRISNEESLRRLFLLQPQNATLRRIDIATRAFYHYRSDYAFSNLISLYFETKDWGALNKLYKTPLARDQYQRSTNEPMYWYGLSLFNHVNGMDLKARTLLFKQVLNHPRQKSLQQLYFNFLIYQSGLLSPQPAIPALTAAMAYYQKNSFASIDWINAYTSAFNLISDFKKALVTSSQALLKKPYRIDNLLQQSNILYELKAFKSASLLRDQAYAKLNTYSPDVIFLDNSLLSAFYDLAVTRYPVNSTLPLLAYLANQRHLPDTLISHAILHNNISLAEMLLHANVDKPLSAVTQLAILRHDKTMERRLVTTTPDALAPKEAVQAALDAGDIRYAQNLAYQALGRQPDEDSLNLFKQAASYTQSQLTADAEFEQFGDLQGMREILQARFFQDGYEWRPYLSVWNPQTNNTGNLSPRSYLENIVKLSATVVSHQLTTMLEAGYHQALFKTYPLSVLFKYTLTDKDHLQFKLGYNQRSTLNVPMVIAGSQDEYHAGYEHRLTARDAFFSELQYNQYQLQDRTQLGSSQILRFGLNHQYYFNYPDVSLNWSTDIDRFTRLNSYLNNRVNLIFPKPSLLTRSTFIPNNFWQTSVTLNMGQAAIDNTSNRIKPYGSVGLLYNQTAGYGSDVSLGIVTRLFGHDRFKAYYNRTSITSGQSQTDFTLGVSYELYL